MSNENEINIEEFMDYTNNPDLDPTIQSFFQRIKSQKPTAILYKAFQRIIEAIKTISEIDKDQIPGINLRALAPSFSRPTSVSNDKYTAPKGTRDKMGKQELAIKTLLIALGSISALSTPVYANQSPAATPNEFATEYASPTSSSYDLSTDFYVDLNDPNLNSNSQDNLFLVNKIKNILKYKYYYLSGGDTLPENLFIIQDKVQVAIDENGNSLHAIDDLEGHYSKGHNVSRMTRYLIFNGDPSYNKGTFNANNLLLECYHDPSTNTIRTFADSPNRRDTAQHVNTFNAFGPIVQSGAAATAFHYAYFNFNDPRQAAEALNQFPIFDSQVSEIPGLPGSTQQRDIPCR